MSGWTIRVEEDEVEVVGVSSGFTHTSIAIYGPNGTRGASVELVADGGVLGSNFNVTFQSAENRIVNENPQTFVSGLSQTQAEQILNEAYSNAINAWNDGANTNSRRVLGELWDLASYCRAV